MDCQTTKPDGSWEPEFFAWFGEHTSPTEVRITCAQEANFVSGTALRMLDVVQSPLIVVPVLMVLISPLLFFPKVGMTLLIVFSVKTWLTVFLRGQRP